MTIAGDNKECGKRFGTFGVREQVMWKFTKDILFSHFATPKELAQKGSFANCATTHAAFCGASTFQRKLLISTLPAFETAAPLQESHSM